MSRRVRGVRYFCMNCWEVGSEPVYYSYGEAKEVSFTCPTCGAVLRKLTRNPLCREIQIEEIGEVESESCLGFGKYKIFKIKNGSEEELVCTCPGFLRKGTCKHLRHLR